MTEKTKLIAGIVIITVIVLSVGALAVNSIQSNYKPTSKPIEAQKPQDDTTKNEKEVEQAIESASKIEGQEIKQILNDKIILDNDAEIPINDRSKVTCQVGDVITDFNAEKSSLECKSFKEGKEQPEVRYVSVATPQQAQSNGTADLLTNFILFDYLTSRPILNNNGYNRSYQYDREDNGSYKRSTNYKSDNGTNYNIKKNSNVKVDTSKNVPVKQTEVKAKSEVVAKLPAKTVVNTPKPTVTKTTPSTPTKTTSPIKTTTGGKSTTSPTTSGQGGGFGGSSNGGSGAS